MNNYEVLSESYQKSDTKPDKQHSMLPTILALMVPLEGKIVVDVGCGNGFFTIPFAAQAKQVYGIDNSMNQLAAAQKKPNIRYIFSDMMEYDYPRCDRICAPFVLNYLPTIENLSTLFLRMYNALTTNGRLVGLLDMPQSPTHDMKKYGSIKRVAKLEEGEVMDVELYNEEKYLLTLHSWYHAKENVEQSLKNAGFSKVEWITPTISEEGIAKYSQDFWNQYLQQCDLAYFSAQK